MRVGGGYYVQYRYNTVPMSNVSKTGYVYLPPDIASGEYNVREESKQHHEVQIHLYSPPH